MATIPELNSISQEVRDKYAIADNAFTLTDIKNAELDTYKNEPKDEINVEVGDSKTPDSFLPQVKLMRWTNETNFSLRLVDKEAGAETITTSAEKIKWSKGNLDIEYYDFTEGEGGYKMVWYLKEKPTSNKLEFTIQSKGLDFFYQPELTPEEIAEGASQPENVVGSYAVYHSTKGGMNDVYGKDYKVGKAFHIFRPKIIDAEGKETWGILHIENGIYSVEIPQEFLDKAVYPIKSNDEFGYHTIGGTDLGIYPNGAVTGAKSGSKFTLSVSGNTSKLTAYVKYIGSSRLAKGVIYNVSSGEPNNLQLTTSEVTINFTIYAWTDFTGAVLLNASDYYLALHANSPNSTNYLGIAGDSLGTNRFNDDLYSDGATDPFGSASSSSYQKSIYATYTPSGGTEGFNIALI